jgi:hypothetical protein
MAFKHILANKLSFLLTSDGVPSGYYVNNEIIPIGSLSIDRVNAKVYQLQTNSTWSLMAGTGGAVPSQLYEQLTTASTSAPFVYHLSFNPVAGSVQIFVNGQLALPSPLTNFHYTLTGLTVTWSGTAPFAIDVNDQVVAHYSTLDF